MVNKDNYVTVKTVNSYRQMIKNIYIYFIIILNCLFIYCLFVYFLFFKFNCDISFQQWEKWQGRGEWKVGDGGNIWNSEWNIKSIISICSTVIIFDLWN